MGVLENVQKDHNGCSQENPVIGEGGEPVARQDMYKELYGDGSGEGGNNNAEK